MSGVEGGYILYRKRWWGKAKGSGHSNLLYLKVPQRPRWSPCVRLGYVVHGGYSWRYSARVRKIYFLLITLACNSCVILEYLRGTLGGKCMVRHQRDYTWLSAPVYFLDHLGVFGSLWPGGSGPLRNLVKVLNIGNATITASLLFYRISIENLN